MLCAKGGISFVKSIYPVNQRNYGIDFLRLVSAFYIIILHTIYQGGIYYCVIPGSAQEKICQVLLSVFYCAVNMFGIISGYVGYFDSEKDYKFKNYILLWIQVVFYGIVITCCGRGLFPAVDSNSWLLHTIFPLHLYAVVLYTMLFARIEFRKRIQKLIVLAAPGVYSVYIVNVHPFVWAWMKDRFCHWATCSALSLLCFVFAFAFLFVSATVTVDYFHRKIFRILHIMQSLLKITSENST